MRSPPFAVEYCTAKVAQVTSCPDDHLYIILHLVLHRLDMVAVPSPCASLPENFLLVSMSSLATAGPAMRGSHTVPPAPGNMPAVCASKHEPRKQARHGES
jgi:hypothetical protein